MVYGFHVSFIRFFASTSERVRKENGVTADEEVQIKECTSMFIRHAEPLKGSCRLKVVEKYERLEISVEDGSDGVVVGEG